MKNRIEKFEESLKQKCEKSTDSFFNAILWGTYLKLKILCLKIKNFMDRFCSKGDKNKIRYSLR